jgi:hypothetical protein
MGFLEQIQARKILIQFKAAACSGSTKRRIPGLKMIDARELFGQHKIYVGFRRKVHLSETLLYFVQLYAPKVLRQTIEAAVNQ